MYESFMAPKPANKFLKRCSKCLYASFCGKNCQRKGWEDHKKECKRLKYLTTVAEDVDLVRLIGRVIYKLNDSQSHYMKDDVGSYSRGFSDLMSHKEERKHDHKEQMRAYHIMELVNTFIGPEDMPSDEEFLEIYGKVITNQTVVQDGPTPKRGVCLYLGASIFDHACIPNAVFSFQNTTVYVRALTNIADRDMKKVNVSYLNLFEFNADPYRFIHRQFFAPCQCSECSLPYGESILTKLIDKNASAEVIAQSQLVLKEMENGFMLESEKSKILQMCENCLKKQQGILGDTNLWKILIIRCAIYASVTDSKLKKYFKKYLHAVRLCFGENSYHVANAQNQLGKVNMLTNKRDRAIKYFRKARDIYQTIYGTDHPIVERIEYTISECVVLNCFDTLLFKEAASWGFKT